MSAVQLYWVGLRVMSQAALAEGLDALQHSQVELSCVYRGFTYLQVPHPEDGNM